MKVNICDSFRSSNTSLPEQKNLAYLSAMQLVIATLCPAITHVRHNHWLVFWVGVGVDGGDASGCVRHGCLVMIKTL